MENTQLSQQAFYIILALAAKPRHGYDIMKQAESDSQGQIIMGPGTLYGAIKRMLSDELIVETTAPATQPEDERGRRYYQLTDKGRQSLASQLQQYQKAIDAAHNYRLLSLSF